MISLEPIVRWSSVWAYLPVSVYWGLRAVQYSPVEAVVGVGALLVFGLLLYGLWALWQDVWWAYCHRDTARRIGASGIP
jgi:hypothetical protein